jgi:lipopolysaccharide transport system ATP-binding protein
MSDAIRVQGVGKQFRRFHVNRPATLQEAILTGLRRLGPAERFWVLRDITFNLGNGRMLGVLGANGAGKSTLLRLIGGIGRPDEGRIHVQGRIGGLLELGAGFHPDLTGRENIYVNGVVSGLTRREVTSRLEAIIDFAELEDAIDNPLRTYSTGMRMRLGFAVAIHTEPEVLLIDEVLAVGDVAFRRKCFERIEQFKRDGFTLVFVSHESNQVLELCDEALWLRDGRMVAYGDPDAVVNAYINEMSAAPRRTPAADSAVAPDQGVAIGDDFDLRLVNMKLLDESGTAVTELDRGDPLIVEIEYWAKQPVRNPIFGVSVKRSDNQLCCQMNTASAGMSLGTLTGRGRIRLHLERLDLVGGRYHCAIGAYSRDWDHTYDFRPEVCPFRIRPTGPNKGILLPAHHWEMDTVADSQPSAQAHPIAEGTRYD